jgi:diaminopimelate decarboxylase
MTRHDLTLKYSQAAEKVPPRINEVNLGDVPTWIAPSFSIPEPLREPFFAVHFAQRFFSSLLDTFREAIDSLHRLADNLEAELGRKIRMLNIGGGLAGWYLPEMPPPSIADLVKTLMPMMRSQFEYFVEPGNSLVGDTMCLITKVVMVKRDDNSAIAIMDVGYDQLIYHRPFHVRTSEHEDLPNTGNDAVAGPLCFSGDIIRSATTLNGVKRGDYLYLPFVGAYCYAASNHFNRRQYGGMVV